MSGMTSPEVQLTQAYFIRLYKLSLIPLHVVCKSNISLADQQNEPSNGNFIVVGLVWVIHDYCEPSEYLMAV